MLSSNIALKQLFSFMQRKFIDKFYLIFIYRRILQLANFGSVIFILYAALLFAFVENYCSVYLEHVLL